MKWQEMKVKIRAISEEALYLVQLLCPVQVKAKAGVGAACYQKQVTILQR